MKNIHSLVLYALVTPALALGASSVLAQQTTGQQSMDRGQQSTERGQGASPYTPGTMQRDQGRAGSDGYRMDHRGYMSSVPADGMQASNLMGATVKTTGNEDVGSVDDLIIDRDGQIVAIIVGVGGFLGMGETDVAIGWDDVTLSGHSDDLELRIDQTEADLRNAPQFERRD